MNGLRLLAIAVAGTTLACGWTGGPAVGGSNAAVPRRTAVWVGQEGLDEATAVRLHMVGVDELVVWRGRISLIGGAPVVRLQPWPDVAGPLQVTAGFALDTGGAVLGPDDGRAVWSALEEDVAAGGATALVLDVARVSDGLAEFLAAVSAQSGLPVVPLLTVAQLHEPVAVAAARVARTCVVPVYGSSGRLLRGLDEQSTVPLHERLAPLADSGVRVRMAIALRPAIEPAIERWGESLDPLTEDGRCEISTSSRHDRTFTFRAPFEWSGRRWSAGESVAVGWFDAMRLNAAIAETTHLVLPEVAGWDLVPVPPPDADLGVGLTTLERYLSGEGPRPSLEVSLSGSRATRRLVVRNRGPFTTAVSASGSWFQVAVDDGRLVAEDRGGFDKISIGTARDGAFRTEHVGAAQAVRFFETFIGPGEEIESGPIRLSTSRATVQLRWEVVLSTGEKITGESQE